MSRETLALGVENLALRQLKRFVYKRNEFSKVMVADECLERAAISCRRLNELMERRLPIYGVTTGFGDSCFRFVDPQHGEMLQANLVSYLLCGSGPLLPVDACRAMFLIRLKSLSRGFSGVSVELLERMRLFLANDWIPAVPCEGSLGASGDLIPLAYLAQCLQGEGQMFVDGKLQETADVLARAGVAKYRLKPKEGLALVNGTSAMAGLYLSNLVAAQALLQLSSVATAWLCLVLRGRTEPFDILINEKANLHTGQRQVAATVLALIRAEGYACKPLSEMILESSLTSEAVQDRYSLRCAPQILGPVTDTVQLLGTWLEEEINGSSDNPLLEADGNLGMGGNFYGGYLSQGMDYLKISLAHIADMVDRQLAMLIDEKSNRGLPANLANWPGLAREHRHLHHGLKGLHQSVSAITSEIMAKAMPNGIFSRSAESHNQDKVSLGMSAAVQCQQLTGQLYTVFGHYLICLAQAVDLRSITLRGEVSQDLYALVRRAVPFVAGDRPLDRGVQTLRESLMDRAERQAGETYEKV